MQRLPPLQCTPDERAEMLENTRWASKLTWEQIRKLATYMQAHEVKRERIIIAEGSEEQVLGFVIKGILSIEKKDETGKYVTLSKLNSSQSFGEMSFIDGQPASARVTTATDTLLLALTKNRFDDLVQENSALALQLTMIIAQMLSHRLRNTSGKLVDYLGDN